MKENMDNAFYIKDDDYYPENYQGMKMSIVEEQVNQESVKQDEEEDEKENNSNNDDVFQEEQRINNFSFGKHDKRLMEESSKNEETSNPKIYIKNIKKIIKMNKKKEKKRIYWKII